MKCRPGSTGHIGATPVNTYNKVLVHLSNPIQSRPRLIQYVIIDHVNCIENIYTFPYGLLIDVFAVDTDNVQCLSVYMFINICTRKCRLPCCNLS